MVLLGAYRGQNLTGASFRSARLDGADLSGAIITEADFAGTSVTKEQLYSTASYQAKDLRGIQLTTSDDLADWDFSGQDLTNARIGILTNANLTGAVVHGDYAVVGDFDGYLHWLRLSDGQFAARAKTGGELLRATPVVADGVLVVQNVDGELSAFRLQ